MCANGAEIPRPIFAPHAVSGYVMHGSVAHSLRFCLCSGGKVMSWKEIGMWVLAGLVSMYTIRYLRASNQTVASIWPQGSTRSVQATA